MSGNVLLTIDMVTREAVQLFKNSNAFMQNIAWSTLGLFTLLCSTPRTE